jgi:hypothetical protein
MRLNKNIQHKLVIIMLSVAILGLVLVFNHIAEKYSGITMDDSVWMKNNTLFCYPDNMQEQVDTWQGIAETSINQTEYWKKAYLFKIRISPS